MTTASRQATIRFPYKRSLGPVMGAFMTALTEQRFLGIRSGDRVLCPPREWDPNTAADLAVEDLVEVGPAGTVESWTWVAEPTEAHPLDQPFAFALIRLDGADTCLLHAVDVASADDMRTGMRVRARWAEAPVGEIRDIVCFEPESNPAVAVAAPTRAPTVEMVTTPIALHYRHTASPQESRYLVGLQEGRLIGQRCPACQKVYVPPRGACPTDGVPTVEDVELPGHGTVTTFCIVNVPFMGQRITPPYVAAYVLLDGADIAFLHLVLGCEAADVRMGMRVEAVWRPREEWGPTLQNIDHFRPTGEPDAPYESYAEHL